MNRRHTNSSKLMLELGAIAKINELIKITEEVLQLMASENLVLASNIK